MIGADTDEEALRQGFLDGDDDDEADESFDDRHAHSKGARPAIPKEQEHLGGERAARYLIGEDDDEDDDDKYRKQDRRRGPAAHAVGLLQSSHGPGESARGGIEMRTLHDVPSRSSAQPGAPVLPPYTPRADGVETADDGDWDGAWSGSEATTSRPASPALGAASAVGTVSTAARSLPPAVSTIASHTAPTLSAAAAGISASPQLGADDDWGFAEETAGAQPAGVLFDASTLDEQSHTPPLPTAPPSIPVARQPVEVAEPEADEWGLDLDDSASVHSAVPTPAPPAASQASAVLIPTTVDAAVETPVLEEDDWGFQEDAAEDEPTSPVPEVTIAATPADKAEPDSLSARKQPTSPLDTPEDTEAAPVASGADDDLDDWGFHDSPSLTQDVEGSSEVRERVDRPASTRGAAVEQDLL